MREEQIYYSLSGGRRDGERSLMLFRMYVFPLSPTEIVKDISNLTHCFRCQRALLWEWKFKSALCCILIPADFRNSLCWSYCIAASTCKSPSGLTSSFFVWEAQFPMQEGHTNPLIGDLSTHVNAHQNCLFRGGETMPNTHRKCCWQSSKGSKLTQGQTSLKPSLSEQSRTSRS